VNALHIAIGGRRFAVGGAERRRFFPGAHLAQLNRGIAEARHLHQR